MGLAFHGVPARDIVTTIAEAARLDIRFDAELEELDERLTVLVSHAGWPDALAALARSVGLVARISGVLSSLIHIGIPRPS